MRRAVLAPRTRTHAHARAHARRPRAAAARAEYLPAEEAPGGFGHAALTQELYAASYHGDEGALRRDAA